MNFFDAGKLRGERAENVGRRRREKETEARADEGEEKRFRKQLSDERTARSAQGEADGDFVLTLSRARQKQSATMLVQAISRSRETEPKSSQRERRESATVVSLSGSMPTERSRVGLGKLAAELCLHGGEIGAGLCDHDAGLEATDHGEPVVFPGCAVRNAGRNGAPQIRLAIWKQERGRHYADDGSTDDHRGEDFFR